MRKKEIKIITTSIENFHVTLNIYYIIDDCKFV